MTLSLISTTNRNTVPSELTPGNQLMVKAGDINPVITQVNTNTTDITTLQGYDSTSNPTPLIIGREINTVVTITAAEIVGTSAGTLGHASGVTLVAAPSSDYALEFVRAMAIYDFDTAAYTGGGNDTTINIGSGGAVLTGVVTAGNLIKAAGDKVVMFVPLSTAAMPLSVGTGISMNSVTAFTQPGTAAGILRVHITYKVHATGL